MATTDSQKRLLARILVLGETPKGTQQRALDGLVKAGYLARTGDRYERTYGLTDAGNAEAAGVDHGIEEGFAWRLGGAWDNGAAVAVVPCKRIKTGGSWDLYGPDIWGGWRFTTTRREALAAAVTLASSQLAAARRTVEVREELLKKCGGLLAAEAARGQ